MFDIYTLVEVLWLILPAYAANGLVPLIKGKKRMDFGKKFMGKPLLGSGKTWEGFIFGCFVGGLIGLIESLAYPFLPWHISEVRLDIVPMSWYFGFVLGFGAMLGDAIGSFIKRRFSIPRGHPAPLLDQEDFLIGSLFFASFLCRIKLEWWILLLIITPVIHWIANLFGWFLKIKKEPW